MRTGTCPSAASCSSQSTFPLRSSRRRAEGVGGRLMHRSLWQGSGCLRSCAGLAGPFPDLQTPQPCSRRRLTGPWSWSAGVLSAQGAAGRGHWCGPSHGDGDPRQGHLPGGQVSTFRRKKMPHHVYHGNAQKRNSFSPRSPQLLGGPGAEGGSSRTARSPLRCLRSEVHVAEPA